MAANPKWFDAPLEDGVYIGLDEIKYFGQECRGSSDWVALDRFKLGWWWQSPYNRQFKRTETKELMYGSALHAIMLEGIAAYEARFAVVPEKGDYVDLVVTREEMRAALSKVALDAPPASSKSSEWWSIAMSHHLPDRPCWYNIEEAAKTAGTGRKLISSGDDKLLRLMRHIATTDLRTDNEDVRKLFAANDDHPPLAEVSVFATIDGIRRRWRFDRMLPAFDLDLKSLGNWDGRPLEYEAGEVLARRRWSIQRADYYLGRHVAYELLRRGRLFGGTIEQRRYIQSFPEQYTDWDWVWLVYQKPDPVKGRAPILMPIFDHSWTHGGFDQGMVPSQVRQTGMNKLNKAIRLYRDAVAEFGLEEPWARVEPMHHTDENIKPSIYLPHYFNEDAPTDAAAYEEDAA